MKKISRRHALAFGAAVGLMLDATHALAQEYPSKPVRIVVPYGISTGLDVVTRALAERLSIDLGVNVIVENISGSNGIIGTQVAAQARPDGYTLLATTNSHYTSNLLYDKLPYDPMKFVPVARLGAAQTVMVTATSATFSDVQSLVLQAKKQPKQLSFASLGVGSTAYVSSALFAHLTGTQFLHVPYKDPAQALTDTVRGEPSTFFVALLTAESQLKAGKLKAIAVTGTKRATRLPDVPTFAEAGVSGFEQVVAWYPLLAPEGTPAAVVQRISASVVKILGTEDFRAMLDRMGLSPMPDGATDFARKLPAEIAALQKNAMLVKNQAD